MQEETADSRDADENGSDATRGPSSAAARDVLPREPSPVSHRGPIAIALAILFLAGTAHVVAALILLSRSSAGWRLELGAAFYPLVAILVASLGAGVAACVLTLRRILAPKPDDAPMRLPVRLLFYVFLAHFIVFHAACQPYHRLVFDLSVAIAFGVVAVGWTLGARTSKARTPMGVLRVADTILMNAGVALLGLELALRLLGIVMPMPLLAQGTERAEDRIDRYRYAPGTLRYGFPVNERGYYDEPLTPKVEGEPLVVSIGDSFAAGVVPHAFHFTTVAERELPGVRIHNVGVPAIGVPEYAYLLRYEVLPLDPDVVVVNLFVGNDIRQKERATKRFDLRRSWYGRENLVTLLVAKRITAVARERVRLYGESASEGGLQGERDHAGSTATREEIERAFPWVVDPSLEKPFLSDAGLLEVERRVVEEGWVGEEPYRALFAALDEMIAIAGDTPLVFTLLPDRCQLDDELWRRVVKRWPEVRDRRDRPQRAIREWFRERGVPVLDLLPYLRRVPALDDGSRHVYHRNDTHFNARGNRIVGEALARFLVPRLAEVRAR